jgi:hypothetical protein
MTHVSSNVGNVSTVQLAAPDAALAYRLGALEHEIKQVREGLAGLADRDPDLHQRIGLGLGNRLGSLESSRAAMAGAPGAGEDWTGLRDLRGRAGGLFDEALAVIQSSLVRDLGLDGGLIGIAERMLTQIDGRRFGWNGVCVLSEHEFSYGYEARTIRLPFPEFSLASLPLAAHEFGHFAGPEIRRELEGGSPQDAVNPFRDLLRSKWLGDDDGPRHWLDWHHAHEAFADIFATYTVGPAYPYACITLRFDPAAAREQTDWHPSPVKRVRLMVLTLKEMDDPDPLKAAFAGIVKDIERRWAGNRAAAGDTGARDAPLLEWADSAFAELFPIMRDNDLPDFAYTGFERAQTLAPALRGDAPVLADGLSIADVLNAAWLGWIEHALDDPKLAVHIERRATELCRRLSR